MGILFNLEPCCCWQRLISERYRNGCKIRPSSDVHKYFDRDGNATLAIVNQECDGQYTCVASNEGGESTISVQVSKREGRGGGEGDDGRLFAALPRVEQASEDKLTVTCKLTQAGEVFLSRIPKIVELPTYHL